MEILKPRRVLWFGLATGTVLIVAAIFSITGLLEETLFRNASPGALKYLYMGRGAFASLLVMALAFVVVGLQHRRAEEGLSKISRAVENSPVSILITDRNGSIEYVNPRFTEMTGYAPEEVLGKNPRVLKSGLTPPELYGKLWSAITAGREWRGEVVNRKKSGEIYDESLSISPIRNAGGEITHFVALLEDVTERKKLQRLKDQLIGTVSHEMRTPLAVIQWSAANLGDGLAGELGKEQKEIVEGIRKNCERLTKIANEVLDLTRLESGRETADVRATDLAPLVREAVRDFQARAQKRSLRIKAELPDLPAAAADPDRILQVLRNLLDNAIRFARTEVRVRAAPQNGLVRVSVADDGPGIAEEDLGRLFHRYQRGRASGRPEDGLGTGLGLAISREVVEGHGGRIWAESALGEGTSVHFVLPAWKEPEKNKENP